MQVPSVDTLVCDSAQIAVWQSAPNFDYGRELISQDETLLDLFQRWMKEFMRRILSASVADGYSIYIWIGVFAILILLLFWFLYVKKRGLFMRSGKKKTLYSIEDDTIYGIDFSKMIAEMLAVQNYKEAVRLLYLQTLKDLSDGKRIDWQLYKTPTQYLYEERNPAFRQLTNHFLRVRYGNFEATASLFEEMQMLQEDVKKGGQI